MFSKKGERKRENKALSAELYIKCCPAATTKSHLTLSSIRMNSSYSEISTSVAFLNSGETRRV